LAEATGWNLTTSNTADLVAPPLGGLMYQSLGKTAPFLLDAVSYAVSAASLLFISVQFQGEITKPSDLVVEIKEGSRSSGTSQ
jgi:hypothetical protein